MDFSFKETINPPAKKMENVFDTLKHAAFIVLKNRKEFGALVDLYL